MALINCPECNSEISDKAHICPHCGKRMGYSFLSGIKGWLLPEDREGERLNKPVGCTLSVLIFLIITAVAITGIITNTVTYTGETSSKVVGSHSDFEVVKDSVKFERRTNNSTVYVTGKITNYTKKAQYIEFEYVIQNSFGTVIYQDTCISERSISPGKSFNFKVEYYDEGAVAANFDFISIIGR